MSDDHLRDGARAVVADGDEDAPGGGRPQRFLARGPDAAVQGDKLSIEIFDITGEILGEAFANFVVFSSPEAIILFGGLSKAGDLIMEPVKRSMEAHMLKVFQGKTRLLFSQLKESDAAVLGASALGWEAKDEPMDALV